MSLTDPIANMLTIIRNGIMARKLKVDVPKSKICVEIADILKRERFVKDHKVIDDKKQGIIRVYLKYTQKGTSAITGIERISKPSLRKYVAKDKMPKILGGIGIAILSTSRGIVTDNQAREMQTGGEVLCHVW